MSGRIKHISTIDGLRAYAAICIVAMHVLANGKYGLDGFVFDKLIPSFTDFVFLFMSVSAFSMCCGYYEKITNRTVDLREFYKKRYKKILPFFAVLCLLDLLVSPSTSAIAEVFANLTLLFGFLPDPNLQVIGVGWFIGLVFVFYVIFPFFCCLLSNKRAAILTFAVALVFHILCTTRFSVGRANIVFSFVFFVIGGLVYLYRDKLYDLKPVYRILLLAGLVALAAVYYFVTAHSLVVLAICLLTLLYAVSGKSYVLDNPVTKFIGNISMEIYLSHMLIFRVLEKAGLLRLFENALLSYIAVTVMTLLGAVVFAVCVNKFLQIFAKVYEKRCPAKEK